MRKKPRACEICGSKDLGAARWKTSIALPTVNISHICSQLKPSTVNNARPYPSCFHIRGVLLKLLFPSLIQMSCEQARAASRSDYPLRLRDLNVAKISRRNIPPSIFPRNKRAAFSTRKAEGAYYTVEERNNDYSSTFANYRSVLHPHIERETSNRGLASSRATVAARGWSREKINVHARKLIAHELAM